MREGLTPKKKCEISHLVGGESGQKWFIFTLFFIFFLSCPKSCKAAKKFFFNMGGRVPLCLKVKIFWTFNVLKKKILKFHTFFLGGGGVRTKSVKVHTFFFFRVRPSLI